MLTNAISITIRHCGGAVDDPDDMQSYFVGLLTLIISIMIINQGVADDSACIYWQRMGMPDFCRQQTTTESITTISTPTATLTTAMVIVDEQQQQQQLPGRLDWCEYWRKVGKIDRAPECQTYPSTVAAAPQVHPLQPKQYNSKLNICW
jgi:hypothetical protein